jgi:hypothetical protein
MTLTPPKVWTEYEVDNHRPKPWVGMPVYIASNPADCPSGWHVAGEPDKNLISMATGRGVGYFLATYRSVQDAAFVLPGEPGCPEMSEQGYQYLRKQYLPGFWWRAEPTTASATGLCFYRHAAGLRDDWPSRGDIHLYLITPRGIPSNRLFSSHQLYMYASGQLELPIIRDR